MKRENFEWKNSILISQYFFILILYVYCCKFAMLNKNYARKIYDLSDQYIYQKSIFTRIEIQFQQNQLHYICLNEITHT